MAQNETGGPCQNLRKLKRIGAVDAVAGDWRLGEEKESRKPTIGQIPILAFFQLSRVEVFADCFLLLL